MNIKQKSNKFRSIVNEMADLYEKKNSNYGDSFGQLFEELGPTAGLVPLWNKLHRATSLIKGSQNNFESLEDTLKDLACYAIMNLIEMEAQKDKECSSTVKSPDYTKCDTYKLHGQINGSFITTDCYGCKHTNCPYFKSNTILLNNLDVGVGSLTKTTGNPNLSIYGPTTGITSNSTDPCEGCEVKKMLNSKTGYVGDLPCQWCDKNPYKLSCGTTTSTVTSHNINSGSSSTHTLSTRTTKGSNNNE